MALTPRRVLLLLTGMGVVSLLADIVYEGARSISGNYLRYLGGPALAAGLVGAGEILAYALRLVSGFALSARASERLLWAMLVSGYAVQAVAVPALALAGRWEVAVVLYLCERASKGLRTPARDTVIARVSTGVGRGLAFGLHELLDQVGAILGPVLVGYMATSKGYVAAFSVLSVPGAAAVLVLTGVYAWYPVARRLEPRGPTEAHRLRLRGPLRVYALGVLLLAMGTAHWSLLSFHWSRWLGPGDVAYLYAFAMAVDAAVSLPLGLAFDRLGPAVVLAAPIASMALPLAAFRGYTLPSLAAALYGAVICSTETVLRSLVPSLVRSELLPLAYGLMGLMIGLGWLIGSTTSSYLYQLVGPWAAASFLATCSAFSLVVLYRLVAMAERKQAYGRGEAV